MMMRSCNNNNGVAVLILFVGFETLSKLALIWDTM